MAEKVDFKRHLDSYRASSSAFRIIDVPRLQYLAIDGTGDPNTEGFAEAVAALYPLGYALKFASRRAFERDYVVMPLEGLWWADDMDAFTAARDKTAWRWTLLMMVPDWVDDAMFADAVSTVADKGAPPRLRDVRLDALDEGRCVQTLHVGSFDDEAAVLERMHREFIPDNGLKLTGRHHEIYLSDARKVEPAKRKTILRQPVR